ncbi:MAG TPA: biotin--[acetyl-CoA-carboxylase] ligase [Candidatus Binatia bacterium]
MTLPSVHPPLSIDDLRGARAAARIGCHLHYFESVDSTNTVAHQLARGGAADGTVVLAETQTKGRGRLGRTWVSPPYRNLYLSVILRPGLPVSDAPPIGLVAGLAVAETVREWTPQVAIKWPNDVLVAGRKVAGILLEMEAEDGRVRFVILGVGVNLNSVADDFPPDLRDKAIGLCTAVGTPVDRGGFAARLLSRLEARYEVFLREGFAAIQPLWEGLSCLTGRHVHIDGGGERHAGVVTGIGADATLRLRDTAGQEIRVVAGDVTVVDGYA